jgi:hypothetical protein
MCAKPLLWPLSIARPIACSHSPFFQRSQSSVISAAETLVLRHSRLIGIARHLPIKVRVALTD